MPPLENVDAIKELTNLKTLYFWSSWTRLVFSEPDKHTRIPEATRRELRAVLPKTEITFPDGTVSRPQ